MLQIVTIDNVEEYIDLVTDFCLNIGICRQMEALKGQREFMIIIIIILMLGIRIKDYWRMRIKGQQVYLENVC